MRSEGCYMGYSLFNSIGPWASTRAWENPTDISCSAILWSNSSGSNYGGQSVPQVRILLIYQDW